MGGGETELRRDGERQRRWERLTKKPCVSCVIRSVFNKGRGRKHAPPNGVLTGFPRERDRPHSKVRAVDLKYRGLEMMSAERAERGSGCWGGAVRVARATFGDIR